MSIWEDEWENYEMDKNDFEEFYNLEMAKQHEWEKKNGKYQDHEYEKWLDENIDDIYERDIMNQTEYPEWMIRGQYYIMTVSNN